MARSTSSIKKSHSRNLSNRQFFLKGYGENGENLAPVFKSFSISISIGLYFFGARFSPFSPYPFFYFSIFYRFFFPPFYGI
jgi:hypothetical protein